MKELSIKEIQDSQFVILKKIKEICEKNNIKYFLGYGTLLGAVRHKNFIPWDDDVDIIMLRPDYERFVFYCNKYNESLEPFCLKHYTTDSNYIYPISRFTDKRYFVDYNNSKNYGLGIFVDIYPFDGCGNNEFEGESIYSRMRLLVSLVNNGGCKKFVKTVGSTKTNAFRYMLFILSRLFGQKIFIKWIDNLAKKHSITNSEFVGNIVWAPGINEFRSYRKDIFNETIQLSINGENFSASRYYDEYLKKLYGDYMILPPEEDRVGHHNYKAYKQANNGS